MKRKLVIPLAVLVFALACTLVPDGQPKRELWPTSTPPITQTPFVVEITTTPLPTLAPVIVVVSSTPSALVRLCVTANAAVNLRPSPSDENYPISTATNGDKVIDLGGRSGDWYFVEIANKQGWILSKYLGAC